MDFKPRRTLDHLQKTAKLVNLLAENVKRLDISIDELKGHYEDDNWLELVGGRLTANHWYLGEWVAIWCPDDKTEHAYPDAIYLHFLGSADFEHIKQAMQFIDQRTDRIVLYCHTQQGKTLPSTLDWDKIGAEEESWTALPNRKFAPDLLWLEQVFTAVTVNKAPVNEYVQEIQVVIDGLYKVSSACFLKHVSSIVAPAL